MSTSTPDTIRIACRECGMVMSARREHAGRRAKCPRCQAVIRIDETPPPEHPSGLPMPAAAPKPAAPTTTSFDCQLCGTRMTFDLKHVGRKAKCPDCYTIAIIPPPEAPPESNTPRAMEGLQYRVYEGDDQPWGVDLDRARPRVLKVVCRVCQTLLDATPQQVGETITCHDCGAATTVKPSDIKPVSKPVHPEAIPTYAVEKPPADTHAAADRPSIDDWLTTSANEQKPNEYARPPRPELPAWPMVTGVFRFTRSQGAFTRWLMLSLALTASLGLLGFAFVQFAAAAMSNSLGAVGYVMIGATAGMLGMIIGLLGFAAFAAHAITLVVETSAGNDEIHQWPTTNPTDWFGEALHLMVALPSAAIPGALLAATFEASLPQTNLSLQLVAQLSSLVVCFPVVLLSQLMGSSPWSVMSPDTVFAIPRTFLHWLMFYAQSAVLAWLALMAIGLLGIHLTLLPLTAGALIFLLAVYFRLLGRLAWAVAERG